MKINLRDECFKQDNSMVRGRKSPIEWDRECRNKDGWTFYTHRHIYKTDNPNKSVLMLWESEILSNDFCPTEKVINNHSNYKYILTSRSNLLNNSIIGEKCRFLPSGGVWLDNDEQKVYNKTKGISLVSSEKIMCPLHILRSQLCNDLKPYIDIFGTGTAGNGWVEPIEYLKDYAFSIVVENNIDEYYFTEKILNCFAAGTVPIYIGATKINTFFNENGIVQCSPDNIRNVLSNINMELYNKMTDAIKDNFERVKQFDTIEKFIYNVYGELFCD